MIYLCSISRCFFLFAIDNKPPLVYNILENRENKEDTTMTRFERTKRYDELQNGDKVWWYGYKGTIRDIKQSGIMDFGPYKGEKTYSFKVDLEPSEDHIEKTIYNGGTYGGVEHLAVLMRD